MTNLNLIKVFIEVIDHSSFTKAGMALNLPKATVSHKIAQLERETGVRLLNRSTRSVTPTPEGIVYAQHCRPMIAGLIDATSVLEEGVKKPRGFLQIKLPTTYTQWAIAAQLPKFLKAYPEIKLKLIVADDEDIDIFQHGTDLVLCVGPSVDSTLLSISLGHSIRHLYASPSYIASHPAIRRFENLKSHDCISCIASVKSKPKWQLKNKKGKRFEGEVSCQLVSTDYLVVKHATIAGLGVSLMPERICREEVKSEKLLRVLPELESDLPEFHALVHPQKLLSPKLRVFIDFLKAHPWSEETNG